MDFLELLVSLLSMYLESNPWMFRIVQPILTDSLQRTSRRKLFWCTMWSMLTASVSLLMKIWIGLWSHSQYEFPLTLQHLLHLIDQLLTTLQSEMQYTNIVKSRVETESNLGYVLSNSNTNGTLNSGCCQKKESCCSDSTSTKAAGCCSAESSKDNAAQCTSSSGCRTATSTSSTQQVPTEEDNSEHTKKRRRFGRTYDLPEGDLIEDYTLFYIGDESPTLSNIMMTHSKCDVYSYNPETKKGRLESAHVNRALMRRYFLVQKAKDADVIGIAVGTLGVGK